MVVNGIGFWRSVVADLDVSSASDYAIKFRPVKPASPHLNAKVERSQRTDLEEFYATADLDAPDLEEALLAWQDHYNHFRPQGSLNGFTPWEKWHELFCLRVSNHRVLFDDTAEMITVHHIRDRREAYRS